MVGQVDAAKYRVKKMPHFHYIAGAFGIALALSTPAQAAEGAVEVAGRVGQIVGGHHGKRRSPDICRREWYHFRGQVMVRRRRL